MYKKSQRVNEKIKISIIIGTRPEIIKMSSVIRECQKRKIDFFILHTNQHYAYNLDRIFFEELQLPIPKYNLRIGSGTHAEQIGKMIVEIEKVLMREKPDLVLVQGDTNTVLAGALVAVKLRIKIGHVEAGLRSYSREMPEEMNRILTDHCSDLLFAPTSHAKENVLKEGVGKNKIFVVGNTIVDAVCHDLNLSRRTSKILEKIKVKKNNYFLLTTHRQENVDVKERLAGILHGMDLVYKKFNLPIIFPIHPRTENKIREFGLDISAGITLIKPLGYFDFLQLENNAKLIFTDSGGIQEESCILGVPCVTLRNNTERPETLKIKSNMLVGSDSGKILRSAIKILNGNKKWKSPFGSGKASQKIVNILLKNAT